MIVPVRCFTCGRVIGSACEEFSKRYKAYAEAVDAGLSPKETPKQILDDLGVDRYCCRRMIVSHVELLDDATPYE